MRVRCCVCLRVVTTGLRLRARVPFAVARRYAIAAVLAAVVFLATLLAPRPEDATAWQAQSVLLLLGAKLSIAAGLLAFLYRERSVRGLLLAVFVVRCGALVLQLFEAAAWAADAATAPPGAASAWAAAAAAVALTAAAVTACAHKIAGSKSGTAAVKAAAALALALVPLLAGAGDGDALSWLRFVPALRQLSLAWLLWAVDGLMHKSGHAVGLVVHAELTPERMAAVAARLREQPALTWTDVRNGTACVVRVLRVVGPFLLRRLLPSAGDMLSLAVAKIGFAATAVLVPGLRPCISALHDDGAEGPSLALPALMAAVSVACCVAVLWDDACIVCRSALAGDARAAFPKWQDIVRYCFAHPKDAPVAAALKDD